MNILSWLSGGIVEKFTTPLLAAYQARLNAQSDEQKLLAEQQIAFFEEQVKLANAAAQHDKWWSTREMIGKMAAVYVFKIVIWDTVLGWGVTPNPGPQVTGIVMLVLGFYFGSKAIGDIASRMLTSVGKK